MAKQLGGGDYLYESVDNWCRIEIPGVVSDVATDSKGQRLPRYTHRPGLRRQHRRHPSSSTATATTSTPSAKTNSARRTACGSRLTTPST